MAHDANEHTRLLPAQDRRLSAIHHEGDAQSIISSHVSKEEQLLSDTAVGERLPYNDYTTIDWLHDLVGGSPSIPGWTTNPETGQRLLSTASNLFSERIKVQPAHRV